MIIAIDAGHYRYTPGKRCSKSLDPKETREWWLNDRMARYVAEYLKGYDCTVLRVDDATGETDIALIERAARANRAGATALISIHHNAGVNGGAGGGICVYTTKNANAKRQEFQRVVYDETVKATGLKGNRATPLPVENHTVTYNANMPAILGEFGFMDSKTDVPIILTDDFSKKCAKGIADAIVKVFNIEKLEDIDMDEVKALLRGGNTKASSWAEDEVAEAVELGITDGSRMQGYATRQEASIMVKRAVVEVLNRIDSMASGFTEDVIKSVSDAVVENISAKITDAVMTEIVARISKG